jgi:hypothetical protein
VYRFYFFLNLNGYRYFCNEPLKIKKNIFNTLILGVPSDSKSHIGKPTSPNVKSSVVDPKLFIPDPDQTFLMSSASGSYF